MKNEIEIINSMRLELDSLSYEMKQANSIVEKQVDEMNLFLQQVSKNKLGGRVSNTSLKYLSSAAKKFELKNPLTGF
jgi:hypothetical protein